mmetsp:Transcript_23738/g.59887  ORF Transcript_23738/g.59887 Transcript_23738/m.59887 type:complete len:589 (-) Transcript_23738:1032-2798(-)
MYGLHVGLRGLSSSIDEQIRGKERIVAAQKEAIVDEARENRVRELQVRELDQKIELLVKAKISLKEVLATTDPFLNEQHHTHATKESGMTPEELNTYGKFISFLRHEPEALALMTRKIENTNAGRFIEILIFYIFGDHYDRIEENLLLSVCQRVLKHEFEECEQRGSFMRGNSTFSNLLTQYARRPHGISLLRSCLSPVFEKLLSDGKNNEVVPSKVYVQYVNEYEQRTGESLAWDKDANEEDILKKQEIASLIETRVQSVIFYANTVLENIFASVSRIPFGIRWICATLWSMSKDRWGDITAKERYSLVGGFIFLRFIGPALVTPSAMGLLDQKPGPNVQRTLVLIQKIIQNLSNGVLFGSKETAMAPFNAYLVECEPKLHNFFDELVDVGTLEERIQMDKFLALGSTEKILTFRMNDVFFLHALFLALSADSKNETFVPIRELLPNLRSEVSRKDNVHIQLPVSFRKPTDGRIDKFGEVEQSFDELKSQLISLLRTVSPLDHGGADETVASLEAYLAALRCTAIERGERGVSVEIAMILEQSSALLEADGWEEFSKGLFLNQGHSEFVEEGSATPLAVISELLQQV